MSLRGLEIFLCSMIPLEKLVSFLSSFKFHPCEGKIFFPLDQSHYIETSDIEMAAGEITDTHATFPACADPSIRTCQIKGFKHDFRSCHKFFSMKN